MAILRTSLIPRQSLLFLIIFKTSIVELNGSGTRIIFIIIQTNCISFGKRNALLFGEAIYEKIDKNLNQT